jgi:hypothetical protein
MPTVTRTVAKGIPPRVRSPATKRGKKVGKEKGLGVAKKRKATTDIEDESSDSGERTGSPSPKGKKGKRGPKRRREVDHPSDDEIEVVENASKPPPEIEEVNDTDNELVQSADNETVSSNLQKL